MTQPVTQLDQVPFAINAERRTPVAFLWDCSGSTAGTRIEQENRMMPMVVETVREHPLASKRCEIAVLAFNDRVQIIQEFVSPDQFQHTQLNAGGETNMGAAIHKALDMVEDRKTQYHAAGVSYTRPLVFLITDGEPTDDISSAAQRIKEYERQKKVAFFALGLEGANLTTLGQICTPERLPKLVDENRFDELSKWFAESLIALSTSRPGEQASLPASSGWERV